MGCATTFWAVLLSRGLKKLVLWVQAPPNVSFSVPWACFFLALKSQLSTLPSVDSAQVWESLLMDEDVDVSTWAWAKLRSSRDHLRRLKRAGPASHGGTRLVFGSALFPVFCLVLVCTGVLGALSVGALLQ